MVQLTLTATLKSKARRLRDLAPRIGRLSVFLVVVAVGLHLLLGRIVRGQVDSTLLDLGAGLVQLGGEGQPEGPRIVELNGRKLHLETDTRAEPVETVLDGAEDACQPANDDRGLSGRYLRGGDGRRGFVACFSRLTPAEIGPVIGEVPTVTAGYRYVYAQTGSERTQVVSIWTEGTLDLEELFPSDGDAPGSDAPGVPRPPDARRVLSAREIGAPQQITLYQSRGSAGELDAWYRTRLAGLGWRPLDGARKPPEGAAKVLVVDRLGSLAALVFSQEESGRGSVAILTSL